MLNQRIPQIFTLIPELLYAENFESPEAFIKALDKYIEYYNNKRIKARLNGKSPVQYRTLSITG